MILNFKDLTKSEQNEAIENLITMNNSSFIAYLLREGKFKSDLYGWFNLENTTEGWEYWYEIQKRIYNEKKKQKCQLV